MKILLSVLVGYLMGSVSPSAFVSRRKGVDIRQTGTKNLGATNALINFGAGTGLLVMLFDVFKAYFAFRLTQGIFSGIELSGLAAGSGAVLGHIFPFYLGFRGGKGFASLCGLILAFNPNIFITLLGLGLALMIMTNFSLSLQLTAIFIFPILAYLSSYNIYTLLICTAVCALVLFRHRSNLAAAWRGEDISVADFIRKHFPFSH